MLHTSYHPFQKMVGSFKCLAISGITNQLFSSVCLFHSVGLPADLCTAFPCGYISFALQTQTLNWFAIVAAFPSAICWEISSECIQQKETFYI